MENQKSENKKTKQLPQNFTQKIKQIAAQSKSGKFNWLSDNSFTIVQSQQATKQINENFDMGFKTFIKFLKCIGCKVKQPKKDEKGQNAQLVYKVTIPAQTVQEKQNVLKQLMKSANPREQYHPTYQQISIEMNMRKPQLELINLGHENQLKDAFLKMFKQNIDSTNKFVDESIYRILVGKQIQKMSPCELFQILTELRDRLFDNQRELQQCIENFQHKIKTFGTQMINQTNSNEESPTLKYKKQSLESKTVKQQNLDSKSQNN